MSGVCCGYVRYQANLDQTVTKFSAIIYMLVTPQTPFKPITDQLSITRHGTPTFNTTNTIGCQLRTKLNPIYIFKTCSQLKVSGVLFVKSASHSGLSLALILQEDYQYWFFLLLPENGHQYRVRLKVPTHFKTPLFCV